LNANPRKQKHHGESPSPTHILFVHIVIDWKDVYVALPLIPTTPLGHRWLVDLPDDSLDGTRSATMAMLRTLLFTGQTMLPLDRAVVEGSAHPCCYLVMKVSHTVREGSPEIVLNNFKKVDADSALFSDETVKVTTFFSNATHHCRRATSPVSETQPIDVPLGGWVV
jgi:hypothetical protein